MKRICPGCREKSVGLVSLLQWRGARCGKCGARVQSNWAARTMLYLLVFAPLLYLMLVAVEAYGILAFLYSGLIWIVIETIFNAFAPLEAREK